MTKLEEWKKLKEEQAALDAWVLRIMEGGDKLTRCKLDPVLFSKEESKYIPAPEESLGCLEYGAKQASNVIFYYAFRRYDELIREAAVEAKKELAQLMKDLEQ